jgi:TolA-binding protein
MAKRSVSYHKGKHLHQEDAFTKVIEKVAQYYTKSPFQAILTTIAAIGIIVFGSIFLVRILGGGPSAPPKEASLNLRTAQVLMQQQNLKAAEDTLRSVVKKYPRTMPGQKSHYYLGQVLYYQGRYGEARVEFAEFEKVYSNKKSFLMASSLYGQANCYEEEGKLDEAAKTYLQLPEKYKESGLVPDTRLSAARCYTLAKQYDRAVEIYEQLEKDYPRKDFPVIYSKAESGLGKIDALKNLF